MAVLTLVRHGRSRWNRSNRFTGWTDVDLTAAGVREARRAGRSLAGQGWQFDLCFTSLLRRAVRTLWLMLEEMDCEWLEVRRDWRLNERHYGTLEGLDKERTAARVGADQVFRWRRGWDVRPPTVAVADPRYPGHDRRYRELDASLLPRGESLQDTVERVLPCWREAIEPALEAGRNVLVVAHGNSLRGLVKHLDGLTDREVPHLEIPTGRPLVYESREAADLVRRGYLDDPGASAKQ